LTCDARGVIVTCAICGQRNRTAYERIGEAGVCGKCRSAIAPPAEPVDVPNPDAFRQLVERASVPVVVDFWAPWCGPCRQVAPEVAKVAANARGRFLVVKVDTQALPALGQQYGIQSIPTMAMFQNGAEIGRSQGAHPAAAIEVFIASAIASQQPRAR